jgi:glycosyltransferase involved in cell wall biosynthesis
VTVLAIARRVERLAVVDPTGNAGGGTRFLRALLPALRAARPELNIRFFGNAKSIARDGIAGELADAGIQVSDLAWTRDRGWKTVPLRVRGVYKLRRRFGMTDSSPEEFVEASLAREIEQRVHDVDLAYFPWPYRIGPPGLDCAIASTIHDLNFKYFFGVPTFSAVESAKLDADIGGWLRDSRVITSSRFMAKEIARFYPAGPQIPVVRLAAFADNTATDGSRDVGELGLGPDPYVLCPTQTIAHKNVGPLIAGLDRLRELFPGLRLVLTGVGTQMATGRATPIGSVRGGDDPDVVGLGYVSNRDMDALIEGAAVVVNPSLYEAGNGPGLDAWSRGAPVAMSNIPSFTEHLDALGVEAALFDPRDPEDIATTIGEILDHRDAWAAAAARSKAAILGRTWHQVAAEYLEVFDAAFASFSNV